jgi:hypothetical protein
MLDTRKPLIAEFLIDHQQFSRLLYEISKLLDEDKLDQARKRAIELNQVAGPHIAYEESELYSRLAALGEKSVTEEFLVGEHHQVLQALKRLLAEEELTGDQLESVKAGFRSALKHAEHCGSLISLMARLDEQQQSDSLVKLLDLRKQGRNWTEL